MSDDPKMQRDEKEIVPIIYHDDSITFALDKDDFKDFVVKLLGKPEVIQGYIEGAYEIDIKSFQSINYHIEKAVCETNDALLIEFTAELFFDDNSSMRFNGIRSFTSHEEIRNIACVGFNFTWIYLVKFKAEKPQQKQEISIFSDYLNLNHYYSNKNIAFRTDTKKASKLFLDLDSVPKIYYSIRSTVPNWGMTIAQRTKLIIENNCLIETPYKDLRLIIINSF